MDAAFPDYMMSNIRDFFLKEDSRIEGLDFYPDVFNVEGFFPLQRPAEMRKMIQIARSVNPKTVMEIGADKGGGFYHWLKGITTIQKAIGVEIRGTPYSEEFEKAFPEISFLWAPRGSLEEPTISDVKKFLGDDPLDVLFIDGDKARFYEDLEAYLPLVRKPGGIVFMHDITDPSPGYAFNRSIPLAPRYEKIIDVSDSHAAMEREARGEPATTAHEHWLRHWKGQSCGVGVLYF